MEHIDGMIKALSKEHGNKKYAMGCLNTYQEFKDEIADIVQKLTDKRKELDKAAIETPTCPERNEYTAASMAFTFAINLLQRTPNQ